MREFNALRAYPKPKKPRFVGPNFRTIKNKITASYRDQRYYDGDRNNGYGGFKYDGRWKKIVESMVKDYELSKETSLLQIGSEKGFLLHDFREYFPAMKIKGVEVSDYAISHSMSLTRELIVKSNFNKLPFKDKEFDFVIAIGVVYTLTLADAISCLKEIQRVGRGKSFITLGAYRDEESKKAFESWSVLGSTILHVDEWIEVLKEAGYTGDYAFVTSETLNLVSKES
jgi:ubiquinone/menaquinone biosynthesis C-methylase UbiE